MNCSTRIAVITAAFFFFITTSPLQAEELRISVAASMTNVLHELITGFSVDYPDVTVIPNFGSSGGLAKQISQGAPADLFLSANPQWMEYLQDQQLIAPSTTIVFAHNLLVFIGKKNTNINGITDLPALERIGIGSPKSVPAGQYAKQALSIAGLYDQLLAAGKLVMAKDVRQALIYADRGETDGSFVYKTDALLAKDAVILFEVPEELYTTITYPVGLTMTGVDNDAANAFYAYIRSDTARTIIVKYGFSLP